MVGRRRVATLSARSVVDLGIRVGGAWDLELSEQAARLESVDRALAKARGYLSRRAHSRYQLDVKLNRAGFESFARREALDRLDAAGLIDDRRFAERLVEELKQRRGAGPRLVRSKLKAAGVGDEDVEAVLTAEECESLNDSEQAVAYARSQLSGLARHPVEVQKRRLYGRMARRGYDTDVIREVVDRLMDEVADD